MLQVSLYTVKRFGNHHFVLPTIGSSLCTPGVLAGSRPRPEDGTLVNGKNLLAVHMVMFDVRARHGKPATKT